MFFLAANFSLRTSARIQKGAPLVLIDYSMSMKNHVARILEIVSDIDFPHETYFFRESLSTKERPSDLGAYTDLTRAIEKGSSLQPALVVLVTDGNHNFGPSPLTVAGEINTPLYVYGVGEEQTRDLSIIDVKCPDYSYPGDSVTIEVTVESGGFQGGIGDATMQLAGGKKLAAKTFSLSDITARHKLDFKYIPNETGETHLNMQLTPEANEISYDNNKYDFSLRTLSEKIRVLYYTDHLSFNTKFILRSISEDGNLSVSSITRLGTTHYRNIESGKQETALPDLQKFDVLILDNVKLERLPWQNIPERISQGLGVILVGTMEGMNAIWQKVTPINTISGIVEGNFHLDIIEPFSVLVDNKNPPVRSLGRVVDSKGDAIIIARANNVPIIGYRAHGRGKIFQISIGDLGTWNFMQHGLQERDLLHNLLGDAVRFLSPRGEYRRLVLSSQQLDYAWGETINLTLQSYDRDFRQAGGGDFYLVSDTNKIPFYETKRGSYEASFIAERRGKMQVIAQGQLSGETLTSNSLDLEISARSPESEYRTNRSLLQRLAEVTNGKFSDLDELPEFNPPQIQTERVSRTMNFNSPYVYCIILILLVVDWIIRRRQGIT